MRKVIVVLAVVVLQWLWAFSLHAYYSEYVALLKGANEQDGDDLIKVTEQDGEFYVVAGWTEPTASSRQMLVVKLTADGAFGNYGWQMKLNQPSGGYLTEAKCICPTSGGYLVAGSTNAFGPPTDAGDMLLCKFNTNGSCAWAKAYGGLFSERCEGLLQIQEDPPRYLLCWDRTPALPRVKMHHDQILSRFKTGTVVGSQGSSEVGPASQRPGQKAEINGAEPHTGPPLAAEYGQ